MPSQLYEIKSERSLDYVLGRRSKNESGSKIIPPNMEPIVKKLVRLLLILFFKILIRTTKFPEILGDVSAPHSHVPSPADMVEQREYHWDVLIR